MGHNPDGSEMAKLIEEQKKKNDNNNNNNVRVVSAKEMKRLRKEAQEANQ